MRLQTLVRDSADAFSTTFIRLLRDPFPWRLPWEGISLKGYWCQGENAPGRPSALA